MIIDRIDNAALYTPLGDRIAAALRYLQQTDFADLADGRYNVRGEQIYAMVQRYHTKGRDAGKWEAHRKYIDVQYVVSGAEFMGVGNTAAMTVTEAYDAAKDAAFLAGPGDFVTLPARSFAILMPQDAHMPGVASQLADIVDLSDHIVERNLMTPIALRPAWQ